MAIDFDKIANFVVPVVVMTGSTEEDLAFQRFAGTAFLLGGQGGLALTAGHVAKEIKGANAYVLFLGDGAYEAVKVVNIDVHPSEDVAAITLADGEYRSPLSLSRSSENAAGQYMLWGYPEAIQYDHVENGRVVPSIDLVYSEGHIRRRFTHPVPAGHIPGRSFYELSTIAGAGCSGAPVTMRQPGRHWEVVGVYVGERRSESGDLAVGYAVRVSNLDVAQQGWTPLFNMPLAEQ